MSKSKTGGVIYIDYVAKKEVEIPVAPCQGWTDPCDFCDKRFGKWLEANEETVHKIPTKPGILLVGLMHKNSVEFVDIIIDKFDIQKLAYDRVDHAKEQVANKKTKVTKSIVVCRWMIFKVSDDKDVTSLCAHWYNNGVLPKFLNSWPGLDILEKTDKLMFSEELHKWCYPKKDAFWKKPKATPSKLVEIVEGCNWFHPCEVCHKYFGDWSRLDEVIANDLAPEATGICMIAVHYGRNREVVNICYDRDNLKLNIKESLQRYNRMMNYVLRNKKFANKSPYFEVRWTEFNDPENENCCFLYAHWLNTDGPIPMGNYRLPGEEIVDRNKNFVVRTHDKKWCYEVDVLKQSKITKAKQKKHILNDVKDDLRDMI